jgi:uncharacterized membrane protein
MLLLSPSLSLASPRRINWGPLQLSPEQHTLFKQVEQDWQQTYADLHPELIRIKGQLRYLMEQPHTDEAEIKRLQERAMAIEMQLRDKATTCFLRKKRALTREQRENLMEQMRQHH